MENKQVYNIDTTGKTEREYFYKDHSLGEKTFTVLLYIGMSLLSVIFLYPFLNVLAQSFSSSEYVMSGSVTIYPRGFSILAYEKLFRHSDFMISLRNTIYYVVAGVMSNMFLVSLAAYALAKKRLILRTGFAIYIAIPSFFSGGLIPTFLLVRELGLYDTWLVFIILSFYGFGHIIILRTFFQNIPDSYEESAMIDGAHDLTILFKIYLPLSKPVLATLGLFVIVGYWNDFFTGLIYLNDSNKFPLQLVLRNFLIEEDPTGLETTATEDMSYGEQIFMQQVIKYSSIVISTLPMVVLFISIQKYFVKGMVIGGIKG